MSCLRGFSDECRGGDCDTVTGKSTPVLTVSEPTSDEEEQDETPAATRRVRRTKPDSALKDQQSTGRKRAARMYPFIADALCEWNDASKSNPKGGGEFPVTVGCRDPQLGHQARHHGPDKNTLNNEPGNVHRICHYHHNLWHRQNDPDYDPNRPLKD